MSHPSAVRRARRGFLAALLLLPLLAAWPASEPRALAAPTAQVTDKLVLAFYYMWYGPTSFSSGQMADLPASPYISDHPDVVERQVQQAKAAGIDGFISSWQGTGTETDRNFGL